ncbi:MAG: type II toxin-antitoxin system HicA family toxin [Methylobacter sp.]|nr:type II toxin-antitoxin system HicA family toxin [Methylococcales bacterium]MDD5113868.1 type II toxin-antitoxin system HicA family toxin [Methylobacter sp.]
MNGKQIIAALKKEGWNLSRIEGSHHIMEKDGMPRGVPIPVHGSKDIGIGLLKAIEKQTGVKLR